MAAKQIVGLFGTLGVPDTLLSNTTTIYEIGEDVVWRNLQLLLKAHNKLVDDLMGNFVDKTTENLMRYGGTFTMDMDELDEHGIPDAQKGMTGSLVGFPLRKFGRALQWTKTYFQQTTTEEFNEQVVGLMDGDVQNVLIQLKTAIFAPSNYNFIDRLVRQNSQFPLPIKALANADGAPIPPGPNSEYFDPSTHTHYLGATTGGTFADADLTSALNTVLHHFTTGQVVIFINQAQENTIRGFTSNFQPTVDAQIQQANSTTYDRGPLDLIQIYNRRIGRYRGADVWVKPWVPAGYAVVLMTGQNKVLRWRKSPVMSDELSLVYEAESHPLRARSYERNFGLGVYNRVGAAVLDSNHTTYTQPTLTNLITIS